MEVLMSRNKITIKDVAREAGVSTATVSYVINNRTDIKISEETRKKVLQVINLLDYTPNQAAKALAANRKSLLAIYMEPSDSILCHAERMYILNALTNYFHENQYEIILLSDTTLEKCDQADAIICYNTSKKSFHKLGDNNFIPLVALDCVIDDPLFFQINSNPKRLIDEANAFFKGDSYSYVMLGTQNEEKINLYKESLSKVILVTSFDDIKSLTGGNILVTDHTLYELLKNDNHVCYVPAITKGKLAKVHECIEAALARTPIDQHDVRI
jgi:DNA-binding LacI/PurR family transcriptional regulator